MRVGLLANDTKKKLMQNFCIAYKGILSGNELYATDTTARFIEEATNLHIHKYLPGTLGGLQQMAAQIANNQMDMVIYLRNPHHQNPQEPDVNDVVKLCDTYNIPVATNIASAELFIRALENGDLEWREM